MQNDSVFIFCSITPLLLCFLLLSMGLQDLLLLGVYNILLGLFGFFLLCEFWYCDFVCVIVHWGLVKMEERYEPLKDLGVGNFGVARLVRDKKTKELVAVKYIEKGKKVISIWSKVNSVMLWVLQMFVLEVVMCFFFLMFYLLLDLKL